MLLLPTLIRPASCRDIAVVLLTTIAEVLISTFAPTVTLAEAPIVVAATLPLKLPLSVLATTLPV